MTPPVVILDRPQLSENIGAAARVMANFGLAELRLVAPRDGWPQDRAWASASGAEGQWQTLATLSTPGPLTLSTGFNLILTAFGGNPTAGEKTVHLRASDASGRCSGATSAWSCSITRPCGVKRSTSSLATPRRRQPRGSSSRTTSSRTVSGAGTVGGATLGGGTLIVPWG